MRKRAESMWKWLERIELPAAKVGLQFVTSAILGAPHKMANQLEPRLKSKSDIDHESAMLELVTYELLRAHGLEVEFEPSIDGASTPDFLVRRNGVALCYVECTCVFAPTEHSASQRELHFLGLGAALRLEHSGLAVLVDDFIPGKLTPSPKKFARFLQAQQIGIDWNQLCPKGKRIDPLTLPVRAYIDQESGWRIDIRLLPPRPSGEPQSTVFASGGSRSNRNADSASALREAIEEKLR